MARLMAGLPVGTVEVARKRLVGSDLINQCEEHTGKHLPFSKEFIDQYLLPKLASALLRELKP